MAKIKDLSPKLNKKLKPANQELRQEYQAGVLPFGQNMGGTQMFSNEFKRGYGDKVFGSSQLGIWLGAADWGNAPFRVNMDGELVATSADFSGTGYTKINIFKQDSIPTSVATGDLWFDTDDGNKLYRAGSAGADQITAGEWEAVQDADIATAQSTANSAQSTANSKIKVFAQDSIPTSVMVGDIWYDTNNDNKPYVAESVGADQITSGEWVIVDDQRAADALLKAGTSQNLTGDIRVGTSNVKIDGDNKRILINDGSNDRILIGYQSGGF
jgi:hypothetical protein